MAVQVTEKRKFNYVVLALLAAAIAILVLSYLLS
jgi:hypothetical protein